LPLAGGIYSGEETQEAAEYIPDIFERLFQEELFAVLPPTYLERQVEVTSKMRAILVDWLVDVHVKYGVRNSTLFLTVNLVDRYLARAPVTRKRLQLIGIVATFVATKFEEVDPPTAADLAYITDSAYTKEDIFSMECSFLAVLDFKILVPTAAHFLEHLQRINGCDAVHKELALHILELGLLEAAMARHLPSCLASAALLLSNELLGRPSLWPNAVAGAARHTRASLKGCAEEFRALLDGEPRSSLGAISKKYAKTRAQATAPAKLCACGLDCAACGTCGRGWAQGESGKRS